MNKNPNRIVSFTLIGAILVSMPSCLSTLEGLDLPGSMPIPIPIPGGNGFRGNSDAQKIIAGIAVAIVAVKLISAHQASQRQRQLAEEKAKNRFHEDRNIMRKNNVRKVAVVVPPSQGKEKGVMFVDENGNTNGKVYVPENSSKIKEGKIIDLGGNKGYLANSWHGV